MKIKKMVYFFLIVFSLIFLTTPWFFVGSFRKQVRINSKGAEEASMILNYLKKDYLLGDDEKKWPRLVFEYNKGVVSKVVIQKLEVDVFSSNVPRSKKKSSVFDDEMFTLTKDHHHLLMDESEFGHYLNISSLNSGETKILCSEGSVPTILIKKDDVSTVFLFCSSESWLSSGVFELPVDATKMHVEPSITNLVLSHFYHKACSGVPYFYLQSFDTCLENASIE